MSSCLAKIRGTAKASSSEPTSCGHESPMGKWWENDGGKGSDKKRVDDRTDRPTAKLLTEETRVKGVVRSRATFAFGWGGENTQCSGAS